MHMQDAQGFQYEKGKTMVGRSPVMQAVFELIHLYAPSPAHVLITGESGTGKELAARALHYHSGRSGRFVAFNCSAVSSDLFESRLFGHRRGAFTGAVADCPGLFELADGGTLLLDEVGEMPLDQQAKFLRALERGEIDPLGSKEPVRVSVRILAATNKNLAEAVQKGTFRRDLYDRLNVLPLFLPPLRERPEDLAPLVAYLVDLVNEESGTQVSPPSAGDLAAIEAELLSGNVRELKSLITRAAIMENRGVLNSKTLSRARGLGQTTRSQACRVEVESEDDHAIRLRLVIDRGTPYNEIETSVGRAVAHEYLKKHGGQASAAMDELGVGKSRWTRLINGQRDGRGKRG